MQRAFSCHKYFKAQHGGAGIVKADHSLGNIAALLLGVGIWIATKDAALACIVAVIALIFVRSRIGMLLIKVAFFALLAWFALIIFA